MRSMADAVRQLVKSCHGDDRTDCPILSDLSGETPRRREGVAARAHAKPNAASATTTPRHGALQMLGGKKRPAASRKSPGVSTAPVKIGP